MSKRRRPPEPSEEDRALWDAVAKTIAPLKQRPNTAALRPAKPDQPPKPATKPPERPAVATVIPPPARPSRPSQPPRLAPLDRRARSRITRGTVSIDARIDLHGMTQASAHRKLRNFIEDCQENGKKIVLVITGKGRPDATHGIDAERGILRRQVPIWLGSAELRSYVIGYEPAGRSHGGEGALYVRIRSRRKSDS